MISKLIFALFATTVFLNSFLLFQIQPIFARSILPWFGGSAAVWTSCLLFFQVMLLAGYVFAHLIVSRLSKKKQAIVYLSLVAVCLLTLHTAPELSKGFQEDSPMGSIFLLLGRHIGLPYFLVSCTTPLLQAWFSKERSNFSVYRLYALSNIGSLLALIAYPSLLEPSFAVSAQHQLWTYLFYFLAALLAGCALRFSMSPHKAYSCLEEADKHTSIAKRFFVLWFLLPACASALLLAVTNYVCYDLAVIPFLWIAPLVLYLLSFILTFDSPWWYRRGIFMTLALIFIASMCRSLLFPSQTSLAQLIIEAFLALFAISMMCHGELVRIKPSADRLTLFYLFLSAGGAAGGVFVALISPNIFNSYMELPLSLLAAVLLGMYMLMTRESLEFYSARLGRVFWATTLGVGIGALVTVIGSSEAKGNVIHRSRNFYGVLSVLERDKDKPRDYHRLLRHGRTIHGIQYMLSEKQDTPVTYYPNDSGIGRALRAALLGEPKHIGVIGMGAGVVAAYGRKGDRVRFYEIDPDVISAADNYFYFTKNSKSEIDVVLGDARLSMEREPAQEFDLFIIDAFSSAAIPTHLLTKEAFEVYLRHLKPGGVFVLHITNRYIDLRPVVARLARKFGLEVRAVKVKARPDELVVDSIWVIMTSNSEFFDKSEFADIKTVELPMGELWTDDYSNVFGLLKW